MFCFHSPYAQHSWVLLECRDTPTSPSQNPSSEVPIGNVFLGDESCDLKTESRCRKWPLTPNYINCSLVAQSCPTLCNPMDCRTLGSSIHGISQARILEWVAISFLRGSSQPRDRTCVSNIAVRFFTQTMQIRGHHSKTGEQVSFQNNRSKEIIIIITWDIRLRVQYK